MSIKHGRVDTLHSLACPNLKQAQAPCLAFFGSVVGEEHKGKI